ncbi:site-2 protease family protein [Massilia pseudoviolaceinigra]|uniref:site-2 protease family protein n=1 Tax=Massilia pseudoviolaceinigra TaxID=3057165 RepID=UPI0035B534AA
MLLTVYLIWAIISHAPVLVTAWVARSLGIVVGALTLGAGPVLLKRKNVTLRLIPINSSVRFKTSQFMPLLTTHEKEGALEVQPVWAQLLVTACIPACLLAIACVLLGVDAPRYFASSFSQILTGALSPLTRAQAYLAAYHAALAQQSFGFVLGLTAAKMAAFNLLPLGSLCGIQLIVTVVEAFYARAPMFPRTQHFLTWITLLIMASWAVAGFVYVMSPP